MPSPYQPLSEALIATTPSNSPKPGRSLPELNAEPDARYYPTCPVCETTAGYRPMPDDPDSRWQRCPDCCQRELRQRAERRLLDAGLTAEEIARCTLGQFRAEHETQQQMLAAATAFADGSLDAWSLSFAGGMGSGKTHLLVAAIQARLAAGETAVYVTAPSLFAGLRTAIAQQTDPDAMIAGLVAADTLALDEFPTVDELTDWRADQLDRLINDRYRGRKATIVASNHLPAAWPPRVRDRLTEGVIVLTADLPSWRAR